jgi:hypothetical protein
MSEASLAREAFCHGSIRRERVEQIVAFEGSQFGAVMHTGREKVCDGERCAISSFDIRPITTCSVKSSRPRA